MRQTMKDTNQECEDFNLQNLSAVQVFYAQVNKRLNLAYNNLI